jgi:transposase
MFQDEARFGTMTSLARAWAQRGVPFVVKTKQGRENFYAYAAVAPFTGEAILSKKPEANSLCMSEFLKELSESFAGRKALVFLDRASWHKSKDLETPSGVRLSLLPPCSPVLNPVERLWRHVRTEALHNRVFDTLHELNVALDGALQALGTSDLMRICSCSYL